MFLPKSIRLIAPVLIFAVGSLAGCIGTKRQVILIELGEPVQLAEPVKARVFVKRDGNLIRSDGKVTIPAGWWAISDPGG